MANETAEADILRSPLGRVRGLGTARSGTLHWWHQRLTSIALLPLTLWFAFAMVSLAGAPHGAVVAWIARPWNAVLLLLSLGLTFHHTNAGLQVIIEDYVKPEWVKLAALLAVKATCLVLALAAGLAVLRIAV